MTKSIHKAVDGMVVVKKDVGDTEQTYIYPKDLKISEHVTLGDCLENNEQRIVELEEKFSEALKREIEKDKLISELVVEIQNLNNRLSDIDNKILEMVKGLISR